jgi:undecaprenyl-diphosphatase
MDLEEIAPAGPRVSSGGFAVASLVCGLAFILLGAWIAKQGTVIPGVDERIHAWVVGHRSAASTTIARELTSGGRTFIDLPALIVIGALATGYAHDLRSRLGAGLLLSGVATAGVYLGLQINAAIGRPRPPVADWAGAAGGPAFPSGHTTTATLFAAFCAWALTARVRPGWRRRAIWLGAVLYAAAVGWTRIWLGVHWPTDVLGGWLFGLTWFTGSTAVILALRQRARARRSG